VGNHQGDVQVRRQPHLLASYAQIEQAQAAGQVTIAKTSLVVNCPVI